MIIAKINQATLVPIKKHQTKIKLSKNSQQSEWRRFAHHDWIFDDHSKMLLSDFSFRLDSYMIVWSDR